MKTFRTYQVIVWDTLDQKQRQMGGPLSVHKAEPCERIDGKIDRAQTLWRAYKLGEAATTLHPECFIEINAVVGDDQA